MPDSNDGDVAVFPFMKRTIIGLGKAITAEEIRVSVKKAWKQVTPAVCKKIRARALRNMAIVKVDGRNFYGESMTKACSACRYFLLFLKEKTSTGCS